jgi:hypothetical protein
MKAAALACGIAAVFLAAVLVGVGPRQAVPQRPPDPIQVRQAEPGATASPQPSPTVRKVERPVDRRSVGDYDDDRRGRGRGRGRGGDDDGDNSGPGSGGSGSNSGSGSGGD